METLAYGLSLLLAVAAPLAPPRPTPTPAEVTAEAALEAAEAAKEAAEAAKEAAGTVRHLAKQIDAEIDGNDASEDAEDKDDDDARWTFQLGINGLANYGNANSINAALTAGALGLWGPWKLEIKGVAGYGESGTPTQATQVNSLNGTLTVRGDKALEQHFGTYVLLGTATDRVASFRSQIYLEPGLSLTFWEHKIGEFVKSRLQTSFGFRVMREDRHQYYPVSQVIAGQPHYIYAPVAQVALRYGITRHAYFEEIVEGFLDARDSEDKRLTATTTLTAPITQGTAIVLSSAIRYLGRPAANKKSTNTNLTAGITWSW